MRLTRITFYLILLVACLATGSLHAQVLVSLGTTTGCGALQAAQTCTLSARVTGATNRAVTWSFTPAVSGVVTGAGTAPDATGLSTNTYRAPDFIVSRQVVTATATSVADPTQFASAFITLVPVTITVVVSPSSVNLTAGQSQQFSAVVNGISQTGVTWSITPAVGTIDPATGRYTAPATITATQKITITATSTFDPSVSGTASVNLQPVSPITVTVSPATATLSSGQTQQFIATVTNSTAGVGWSISPQTGFIDANGLYTAPPSITGSPRVTVTATSLEDATKSDTATITLQAASVTVTPATVSLSNGQSQQFTATVQNSGGGVTWSIIPPVGTIDSAGVYTAPALVSGTQRITVTATSVADPTKTGTAVITLSTVVDVGLGAPTPGLQQQFVTAYYRNGFNLVTSLPPLGNVKRLGTTGYVQEFNDSAKTSGVRLALATISPTVTPDPEGAVIGVVQLLANLYAYYITVGAGTAGYPLMDTQTCPFFDTANACTYDLFDKGYALFAYANPLATGQNYTIRQAFYTEWALLGGIGRLGRPVDVETAITASRTGTTATVQTYAFGAVYSVTSGLNRGKTFGVAPPLYDLYVAQGGPAGTLGLPVGEAVPVGGGLYRQTFEGGALQYTPGGDPTVQLPVLGVAISGVPSGGMVLNLGQKITVSATPVAAGGQVLSDRPVSWATSNGKVISVQASGQSAVLTAVGGGTANVTAASGGVTSARITLTVLAPCCAVGAGAPAAVQQSFQDALTRNHVNVVLPVQSAASRVGAGYVQMVQSADTAAAGVYMVAQSDQSSTAYVIGGSVLSQYQKLGGPAGALGYPTSDKSAGGTQLFANNSALAGSPALLVSGGVLTRWAQLGYETGVAGVPTSQPQAFETFGANTGTWQEFRDGSIYAAAAGPRAGQAWFVKGLIAARYDALGGPSGDYGMPLTDEFINGNLHQQNFEGGNITYFTGDAAAVEHPAPKVPSVAVAPGSISAGGRARLAVYGFPNNSTVRVSITGQSDFQFTSSNGAYSWEMSVPLSARSGTVSVRAVDTRGSATADGTLTIRGFNDNRLPLSQIQGNNQTGIPGSVLPLSLKVGLKDAAGAPVVGASVLFQAAPGASLTVTQTVTDAAGQAETFVRLPAVEGITAVTAEAPSIGQAPVSFYLRASASSLVNFPRVIQAGDATIGKGTSTIARKGALLTAIASILRYHQNRGELSAPNGVADASTLNQYLTAYCALDERGQSLCDGFLSNSDSSEQVVNLWRAAEFTGGLDVRVLPPAVGSVADALVEGSPVLLSLALSTNGVAAGGHFVTAVGVAADGSIVIQDPNPFFARASLADYLSGFRIGSATWKAELRGVVQFALRSPSATRFVVSALSQPASLVDALGISIQSASGVCGIPLDVFDAIDSAGNPAPGASVSRMVACDGLDPAYQVSLGTNQPFRAAVTDLAPGGTRTDVSGSSPSTYQASRPVLSLKLAPQSLSFSAEAVVNGANFSSGIAPGGLVSIFGAGLSGTATPTAVELDGVEINVLFATPFQVNAVIPASTAPGIHTLRIRSVFGSDQQPVNISVVAPAIFLIGNPPSGLVANQNGTLNSPSNPLPRGQSLVLYATGLGTVSRQGSFSVTDQPVAVLINGQELPVQFAGSSPYPGVYQVNIAIPAGTKPGLAVPLTLKQGGLTSNTVLVGLQ